jgi:diguanylate cyclase (GGDEF)-like protein
VTESEQLTEKLNHECTHDSLTGLVKRQEFRLRLSHALDTAQRDGVEHVVCYLGLDNFKKVNETCGDTGGDELFRQ